VSLETVEMDDIKPASHVVDVHRCHHLRHKGMYVLTVDDPDERTFYDSYDATAYWCTKTMKALGPDGNPVHADTCRHGRGCCSD
jgi:hypothetical protein